MPLLLLTCVFLFLSACSDNEELNKEQLLRQAIEQLELRFEQRKLGLIIEYISDNYQDERGRGLKDIKRAIQMQLMRHKSLYVFSTIKSIEWSDDENARVQLAAAMAGKPIENVSLLKSIRADMINFTLDFSLEEDKFKVKSATWKWAVPTDFL